MAELDSAWNNIGSVLEKLSKALNNISTTTVQTIETDFELSKKGDLEPQPPGPPPAKPKGLVTAINMLTADIKYMQSPNLPPSSGASLQDIHAKHVALSQKIFTDNLTFVAGTVQKLLKDRTVP